MPASGEAKAAARRESITRILVVAAIVAFLAAGALEFWLQRRQRSVEVPAESSVR